LILVNKVSIQGMVVHGYHSFLFGLFGGMILPDMILGS